MFVGLNLSPYQHSGMTSIRVLILLHDRLKQAVDRLKQFSVKHDRLKQFSVKHRVSHLNEISGFHSTVN